MVINVDIEKIAQKTSINTGDVTLVLRLINEILETIPANADYDTLLFDHKTLVIPLINYAYSQYTTGTKADIILSNIKNIINGIEAQIGSHKGLRLIMDLFDVQLFGFLIFEQAKNANNKISTLQSKLSKQETLMKNFIDSFQQLIFLTDSFGNITLCNIAAEKYFSLIQGDPYPKLLGLFDYNYLHTDEFLQTYITRGRREIRLMDGSIFRIEVKALKNLDSKASSYLIILDELSAKDSLKITYEPSIAFMKLTKTEQQICDLIYEGLRNKEIATHMSVSEDTIKNHRKTIRSKLMLNNQKVNLYYFLRENYNKQK